ncbi:MAG: lipoate--protein ligase [Clostridia bacterium]|nr:lipoate--protein ligase [Clostridia bacterium]MBR0436959.1 lipoate--protein ligase [Clostridia bacterium]
MIDRLRTYESDGFDPYRNLAIEQHLLETVEGGCCLLYLWQNRSTVVIGRNQNAWAECRTALLSGEGGRLARRLSGGGAVYHDLGNLNFTFLVNTGDYDLDRQLSVIQTACRMLGVETERSGRNDLLADGRKFSGNAFYHHEGRSYHHGTLLVDVDTDRMGRYLSPSKAKLESKGVESVRSRVVNLKELNPAITVDALKTALFAAFSKVYGLETAPYDAIDEARIAELTAHYASDAWLFGQRIPFTFRCERRFSWGGIELQLSVDRGVVQDARVYTDDMNHETAQTLCGALHDCPFSFGALSARIETQSVPHARDLIQMLSEQEI